MILPLPDLYRTLSGTTKKRYAWRYVRRVYPEYDPDPHQPLLHKENKIILHHNIEKAKEIRKAREERLAARKKKKR